jgi:hypothetical protein
MPIDTITHCDRRDRRLPQYEVIGYHRPSDWWKGDDGIKYSETKPSRAIKVQPSLEAWFNERAERWERQSGIHSSPGAKFLHKDYIAIMTKGEAIVPLIIKRLKRSKKDWLWALEHIVDEKDNPAKGIQDFQAAVHEWIQWGERRYFMS